VPIPDLIDQYRTEHEDWLRRTDELTRLRGEVRAAAERESSEIIARARSDVRRILLQARREVVTLNLQVQAALGTSPAAGAQPFAAGAQFPKPDEDARGEGDAMVTVRREIRDVLEEARAEIDGFSAAAVCVPVPSASSSQTSQPITPASVAPEEGTGFLSPLDVDASPAQPAGRIWLRAPALIAAPVLFLAASMWIGARFFTDDGPAHTPDRAATPNIPVASWDVTPPQPPVALPGPNLPPQPSVVSRSATTPAPANPAASAAPPSAAELPVPLRTMIVGQTARSEPSAAPSDARDVAGTMFSPPGQPVETASEAEAQILAAGRNWLDAYQRGDRSAMAALAASDATVLDERTPDERFAGSSDVRRALDQVQIHVAGNAGTLTAAMTEEAETAGQQHASRLSQTWLRENGKWQLIQARIISEVRLKQFAR